MSDIEWGEPPEPPADSRCSTAAFVAALAERRGEWAKYPSPMANRQSLYNYKTNYPQAEWTARRRADGRHDFYARWVGP